MESSNNSFLWPTVDRRDVATKAVLPVSNSKDHCNTRFLLRTSAESRGMPTACCFINTPARFVLKAFGPHFLSNIWAGPSDRKTIEAGPSVGKTCRPNAGKTSVGPTPKKQMWAQCRKNKCGHYPRNSYTIVTRAGPSFEKKICGRHAFKRMACGPKLIKITPFINRFYTTSAAFCPGQSTFKVPKLLFFKALGWPGTLLF
jgi:hypothetical protein